MKIAKKSFFKKLLPVAVVGAGLAVAGTAWAGYWTPWYNVSNVETYASGGTNVHLEGYSCGSSDYASFDGGAANHDQVVKIALAAMLAGKQVKVKISSGCSGYAIIVAQ